MQKPEALLPFVEHKLNARHYCTASSQQYEAGVTVAILYARKQKFTRFKNLPWATQLVKEEAEVDSRWSNSRAYVLKDSKDA